MMHYILGPNKEIIQEPDLLKWAAWMETGNRIVKQDYLEHGVRVSTVFLGIDHNFYGGPPILFETMIFGGPCDQYQERYCTMEEAVVGHDIALQMMKMAVK